MTPFSIPRRTANIGLFTMFFALSVAGYAVTFSFPSPFLPGYPGSAMFPRLVLIVMGVLALASLLRAVFTSADSAPQDPVELPLAEFFAIVLSLCTFALLLWLLGTEIAVFVTIAAGIWFRTRRIGLSVCVGLISVAVVYLLFVKVLSVHLPLLILPRYWFMGV
jgi:hypothetical protein